ncbi:MAG: translational GTPase TypA [Acidobacteriota bacterium]|jgi:GTP-binding protein|nr:translational GTPase TypA [Acidobacteriota bacterium]
MQNIRNIAIIAHVDHGKTTLIDAILRQTGVFRTNQTVVPRVMDNTDLEREKGITIFSKNAAFFYRGYKVNVVDTPGHADFGGEVQRILRMVDSVLLLVDAFEGPMPQTKYVLKESLRLGLAPIVIINKIDRPNARPDAVLDEVFDLFVELNADEKQLDFPVVYTSARDGYARFDPHDGNLDLAPLLDSIVKRVPEPGGDKNAPLQLLVSAIAYDPFLGRIGTGRIHNGTIRRNQDVMRIRCSGEYDSFRVSRLFAYQGLERKEVESAGAGEIISVAGINDIDVGETICLRNHAARIPVIHIDPPTMAMTFMVNDSPFAGNEGRFVTSRHLLARLRSEQRDNVNLRLEETASQNVFQIKGRGALQFAVLMEKMRREGYEFQVSRPEVIYKESPQGLLEPVETATVDVAAEYAGVVIEMFGQRRGELVHMSNGSGGYTRLEFRVPARGLIGMNGEFLAATRGTGILNHLFSDYEPCKGDVRRTVKGVLIALESGVAVAFALNNLQERGTIFIEPGTPVYPGMIVGEHSRENDLVVNVCKTKKLTNMRAAGSDDAVRLAPPRRFSLEQAIEYINDDELLEITPDNVRMRKRLLDIHARKRESKARSA